MRAPLITILVLLTSACGGNWSNRDLDFVNALPDRAALKSKLPASSSSTNPLTGVETRRDGLGVGDPSTAYADTNRAKSDFNGLIDGVLALPDAIRAYPPTERTDDSRIWGPFADSNNPGIELRLTITQGLDTVFGWKIEGRKSGEDYFRILSGTFKPTVTLKKGQGSFVVHVSELKGRIKVDEGLNALDLIEVAYVTDSAPTLAQMLFTFTAGNTSGYSSIGYASRELEDGSGALGFLLTTTNPVASVVEYGSSWLTNGAGRTVGVVREGTVAGAIQTQCWDSNFQLTYYNEAWPGGATAGTATDCVEVPGF